MNGEKAPRSGDRAINPRETTGGTSVPGERRLSEKGWWARKRGREDVAENIRQEALTKNSLSAELQTTLIVLEHLTDEELLFVLDAARQRVKGDRVPLYKVLEILQQKGSSTIKAVYEKARTRAQGSEQALLRDALSNESVELARAIEDRLKEDLGYSADKAAVARVKWLPYVKAKWGLLPKKKAVTKPKEGNELQANEVDIVTDVVADTVRSVTQQKLNETQNRISGVLKDAQLDAQANNDSQRFDRLARLGQLRLVMGDSGAQGAGGLRAGAGVGAPSLSDQIAALRELEEVRKDEVEQPGVSGEPEEVKVPQTKPPARSKKQAEPSEKKINGGQEENSSPATDRAGPERNGKVSTGTA